MTDAQKIAETFNKFFVIIEKSITDFSSQHNTFTDTLKIPTCF